MKQKFWCFVFSAVLISHVHSYGAKVAHFTLDEGSNDPSAFAINSSVGGWQGMLAGDVLPVWINSGLPATPGPNKGALSFDASQAGNDGYIPTTFPGLLGGASRTLMAWIRMSTNAQPHNAAILHYGQDTAANRFTFRINAAAAEGVVGALRLEVNGGYQTATRDLRDGSWHHVAAVHAGPGKGPHDILLYVDGNLEFSSAKSANNPAIDTLSNVDDPLTLLHIGNASHSLATFGFNGSIDDVQVHDNALTEAQIRDIIYAAGSPAAILLRPADQSVVLGAANASANFNAAASGSAPLTWQWKFNGKEIVGANTSALNLRNVQASDTGEYTVTVSNLGGSASATAQLRLTTLPVDPVQQTKFVGETAQFSISVSGAGPFTYQWQKDGSDIAGGTNATLALRNLTLADAGTYAVKVRAGDYVAVSPNASLRVDLPPSPDSALIAHFKLDEGAADSSKNMVQSEVGGWVGTFSDTTAIVPSWTTASLAPVPSGTKAAVVFDSSDAGSDPHIYTTCTGVQGKAARTVAAWIKAELPQANNGVIVSWGRNATAGRYTFRMETAAGANAGKLRLEVQGHAMVGETFVADGKWHHVAVVTPEGGTAHSSTLYVDGVPQTRTLFGTATTLNTQVDPAVASELVHIGNGGWSLAAYGFNGQIDEVRIYNAALTEGQIKGLIFGSGVPPTIAQALADQVVILGDSTAKATFTVAANGSPPLSYQWKFNDKDLAGETSPTLIINPAGPAQAGTYTVTVSNGAGKVTASAKLSLGTPPIDPNQQVNLEGSKISFNVTMPNIQGYGYQWLKDGSILIGATQPQLTLSNLKLSDGGSYVLRVTLGDSTAVSQAATLRVLAVPSSPYPSAVLRDGPDAFWRLGEANGAKKAADETGFHAADFVNFLGGELGQNGALFNDSNKACGLSSGNISYIDLPLAPELNDLRQFSLEAWISPQTMGAYNIINSSFNLPSRGIVLQTTSNGELTFRTGASANPSTGTWNDLTGGMITEGQWNYVVATFDGTTKRIYVNGTQAGEQVTPVWSSLGLNFRIGAGNGATNNPGGIFEGLLDEVAFYRKALTPAQIQGHYQASGRVPEGFLMYERVATGLNLTWGGTGWILETSASLGSTWTPVAGASSPYLVPTASGTRQFFRLRRP